jgi:hypothetical protein
MTNQELIVKYYMEEKFLPALHKLVSTANPAMYKKWGGNACRQTALFGKLFLDKLLPQYSWAVWDGIFEEDVKGKLKRYNHAWVYGVDKDSGKRLLVDLARQYKERLFIEVTANRYPKDHPEYVNMKELSREKADVADWLNSPEFYTSLNCDDFIAKLVEIIESEAVTKGD